jgi:hypothetical protein
MAAKKRKKKTAKKTGKNQVPLSVLEERLFRLNSLVKRRGGNSF